MIMTYNSSINESKKYIFAKSQCACTQLTIGFGIHSELEG